MRSNFPRTPSELVYRFKRSATAQLCLVLAVAVTFALVMKYWAHASDCGPNDHDGQCGMTTFFGAVFGYAGGFIIFFVAGGWVLYSDLRRHRSLPNRVKDRSADDEAHDFGASLFQERLADDQQQADEKGARRSK